MMSKSYEMELETPHFTNMQAAVVASQVVKGYGTGSPILKKISMNVPKGAIYSLLGSSGCGKTTLLSCILGLKQIESGEILVFGATPGTRESGVPGNRVGYMPQDVSLYNDFSIAESLRYFGTLYGMTSSDITSSQEFLIKCLGLSDPNQLVGQLSGGQKRRVSLAVSLIHSPELLILDEPTVGVDPLLRESIWSHLCYLAQTKNTTVIITTHYIEEARQSNVVGVLRSGKLLAEKNPDTLLQEYNTDLLQNVVLMLCKNDKLVEDGQSNLKSLAEETKDTIQKDEKLQVMSSIDKSVNKTPDCSKTVTHEVKGEVMDENTCIPPTVRTVRTLDDRTNLADSGNRIRASVLKNVTVMRRNYLLMLVLVVLPTLQITLVCLALGNDPKPLKLGIVNMESECSQPRTSAHKCHVEDFSCLFLSKLPNDTIFLENFASPESARDAVKQGQAWGFILFPEGFSRYLFSRLSDGIFVDNATLNGSQIYFEMDFTSKPISFTVKRHVLMSYDLFIREVLSDCGFHPELVEPLKFLTPIYGTADVDNRNFVAPGVLAAVVFFFPMISSSMSFLWDKKLGTMERALVAGTKIWEIMAAFLVAEGVLLVVQQVVCFLIISLGFGITVHGSLITASAILTLISFTGLSFGYLIASICTNEIQAAVLILGVYLPNFVLAGLVWPVKALPVYLQPLSSFLPSALASEAFRSVVNRGWGLSHPNVWPGFATSLIWIVLCWIATVLVFKVVLKRK